MRGPRLQRLKDFVVLCLWVGRIGRWRERFVTCKIGVEPDEEVVVTGEREGFFADCRGREYGAVMEVYGCIKKGWRGLGSATVVVEG